MNGDDDDDDGGGGGVDDVDDDDDDDNDYDYAESPSVIDWFKDNVCDDVWSIKNRKWKRFNVEFNHFIKKMFK